MIVRYSDRCGLWPRWEVALASMAGDTCRVANYPAFGHVQCRYRDPSGAALTNVARPLTLPPVSDCGILRETRELSRSDTKCSTTVTTALRAERLSAVVQPDGSTPSAIA